MALIDRLKRRRDKIQQQLDRWIARGFRGGGTIPSEDATAKETAKDVSEVADLNRIIAERETRDHEGPKGEKRPADVVPSKSLGSPLAFDRGKDSQFLNDGLWITGINRAGEG